MPRLPSLLLAPDKFKGCLTAIEVCTELRTGLLEGAVRVEIVSRPMADGGEGTLDAALMAGFQARTVAAAGPLAEPTATRIGIGGSTALIELAEVCGLARLPEGRTRPLEATTYGVGLAMRAAIELGFRDLVVGIGGSASTDGGMGVAAALGARILDQRGQVVRPCGAGLSEVASVDFGPMLAVLDGVSVTAATDVDSPLLGEHGSGHVFAPQKGASPAQVQMLEAGLEHWAAQLQETTGVDVRRAPAAGAAGGFLAPLLATKSARVVSGAQLVLDLAGTRQAIDTADVVITGEGSWDSQTGAGKAPYAVVAAAREVGTSVIAVAGRFSADADLAGVMATYSLADLAGPDRHPVRDARALLREVGTQISSAVMGL